MHNRRLLYIMNIPSPYRWHLFTRMYEIGAKKGVHFEVVFLGSRSRRRNWRIEEMPRSFPYHVSWSVNFSTHSDRFLNPGLILGLLRQRWDWVILGGYDNPTTAILASLPLPGVGIKLIRTEGNLQAHNRFSAGPVAAAKRFFLSQCDAYLVPGQAGMKWLDYYQPDRQKKVVHIFPNVVDNQTLVETVTQLRKDRERLRNKLGIKASKRLFITPARLEPVKGLLEFLEHLPKDFADNNVWLIAGVGSLQSQLEEKITAKCLEQAVRLIGYVHHEKMPELYAAADIFVLPSLTDPNPLSAIEAAFVGLPLLISKRLGNYPELLQQGVTGWGFDPYNPEEIQQALMQAMTFNEVQLAKISDQVEQVTNDFFDCDKVCNRLLDFLLQIDPEAAGNKTK